MMDLSLIIVNYNVRGFLEALLRSVARASEGLAVEVFVVDNHSTDGSAEMVRAQFPGVHLIENARNLGFAAANNQALRQYRGRYACLVNPDVLLQEDTLRTMVAFMDAHPGVGAAGCKVLNPDGSLQLACRRSIPTPMSAFFKLTGLSRLFPGNRLIGAYNLTYLDPGRLQEVDAVSGSFMVVRRETVDQVGLLDERFFMYGEDLDWFYRMRRAGWRVCYVPATWIVHYKGESAKRSRRPPSVEFYRAMYIFARKHRPTYGTRVLTLMIHGLVTAGIVLKGATSLFAGVAQRALLPLVDLATVNVTPLLATLIRIGRLTPLTADTAGAYLAVHGTYSVVWMGCFYLAGLYGRRRYDTAAAGAAVTAGFILVAAITYFTPAYGFSRAVVLLAWGMNLLVVAGWRYAAARLIGARRRAIIVGADEMARTVHTHIEDTLYERYEVVGFLDSDPRTIGTTIHGITVLNGNGLLPDTLDQHRVDEVIVASSSISYQDILHLVSACTRLGVGLRLVSSRDTPQDETLSGRLETVALVETGGDPVASCQRMIRRMLKRLPIGQERTP